MFSFRSWLNLLIYRFSVSNDELDLVRKDRKTMNNIRRTFHEVERRMSIHERQGGNCSEMDGSGVSLEFMGLRLIAYRLEQNNYAVAECSGESTVVPMENYRKRK